MPCNHTHCPPLMCVKSGQKRLLSFISLPLVVFSHLSFSLPCLFSCLLSSHRITLTFSLQLYPSWWGCWGSQCFFFLCADSSLLERVSGTTWHYQLLQRTVIFNDCSFSQLDPFSRSHGPLQIHKTAPWKHFTPTSTKIQGAVTSRD